MECELIKKIKNIILSEELDIDTNLSDEIVVQQFQDKVDWWNISIKQKMSEKFIIQFQDKVNWGCISVHQKISESFITKFQNKVYWEYISSFQKLSNEFIYNNWDKLDHKLIIINQKLDKEFLIWLYKTDQFKEYNFLKQKPEFKEYSQMLEQQVKFLMIEII